MYGSLLLILLLVLMTPTQPAPHRIPSTSRCRRRVSRVEMAEVEGTESGYDPSLLARIMEKTVMMMIALENQRALHLHLRLHLHHPRNPTLLERSRCLAVHKIRLRHRLTIRKSLFSRQIPLHLLHRRHHQQLPPHYQSRSAPNKRLLQMNPRNQMSQASLPSQKNPTPFLPLPPPSLPLPLPLPPPSPRPPSP